MDAGSWAEDLFKMSCHAALKYTIVIIISEDALLSVCACWFINNPQTGSRSEGWRLTLTLSGWCGSVSASGFISCSKCHGAWNAVCSPPSNQTALLINSIALRHFCIRVLQSHCHKCDSRNCFTSETQLSKTNNCHILLKSVIEWRPHRLNVQFQKPVSMSETSNN